MKVKKENTMSKFNPGDKAYIIESTIFVKEVVVFSTYNKRIICNLGPFDNINFLSKRFII